MSEKRCPQRGEAVREHGKTVAGKQAAVLPGLPPQRPARLLRKPAKTPTSARCRRRINKQKGAMVTDELGDFADGKSTSSPISCSPNAGKNPTQNDT